jgi:FixJ family two-component response regulator
MREGKICILDDDPSVLRSLKELLASDDLEAETFDDTYWVPVSGDSKLGLIFPDNHPFNASSLTP